ncbi:MAG TPA: oxygenase MpaB family protein [Panacibacter sp.]|nr:oxygenase MpaB family protein [Panacibacter sp.]HNP43979.1 oxygenase MpaB family protein [Panacibacter sp.]
MEFFVDKGSVVRQIWGKSDTVLFIFAGASAEFALNKAVDWLYFTGRLPADPLGRLFSTVSYARQIVFSEKTAATQAIAKIAGIHAAVEKNRNAKIPAWAYRDVLFMLIGYSISSFELLERKLSAAEKEEVFRVFYKVGKGLGLQELPSTYEEWLPVRRQHLEDDLGKSSYSIDLYLQYKKHLGLLRYALLIESQKMVCPKRVMELLEFRNVNLLRPAVGMYKLMRRIKLDWLIKAAILPSKYKAEIKALDVA